MSDTPRTNSFIEQMYKRHRAEGKDDLMHYIDASGGLSQFARTLERELAAAEAETKHVRQANENYREENRLAVERVEQAEAKLAGAHEALEKTVWRQRTQFPDDPYCELCGAGQKWASEHGHEPECALARKEGAEVTKLELSKFCASQDDLRYYLIQPWSRGEWSYATNGHIIVRVPRLADVAEEPKAPDAEKMFSDTKQTGFVPVPQCETPPDVVCEHCNGKGYLQRSRHHDKEDCEWCGQTGKIECFDGTAIGNGKRLASFAKRYLAMIQGWEIAPNGPDKAAWIRNGEVTGLLMPRRK